VPIKRHSYGHLHGCEPCQPLRWTTWACFAPQKVQQRTPILPAVHWQRHLSLAFWRPCCLDLFSWMPKHMGFTKMHQWWSNRQNHLHGSNNPNWFSQWASQFRDFSEGCEFVSLHAAQFSTPCRTAPWSHTWMSQSTLVSKYEQTQLCNNGSTPCKLSFAWGCSKKSLTPLFIEATEQSTRKRTCRTRWCNIRIIGNKKRRQTNLLSLASPS
jgi:hypothetical protein